MARPRAVAPALLLVLGCSAPPASPPPIAATEWRLFGAFPVLPAEGYPIELRADGTAVTRNLAFVDGWRLGAGGVLELRNSADPEQPVRYEFVWDPDQSVWVAWSQWLDGAWFVLAPRGRMPESFTPRRP